MIKRMFLYRVLFEESANVSMSEAPNSYEAIAFAALAYASGFSDKRDTYTANSQNDNSSKNKIALLFTGIDNDAKVIAGAVAKTTKAGTTPFLRIYSEDNPEEDLERVILENYSYFLLVFRPDKIILSYLKAQTGPDPKVLFARFLTDACESNFAVENIRLSPMTDPDIIPKINRALSINKIQFNMAADSTLINNVRSLNDLFGLSQNDEVSISAELVFRATPADPKFKKKIRRPEFIGAFSKLKVDLASENDMEETVDLVEELLTRTIDLEIPEEIQTTTEAFAYLQDKIYEAIKDLL